MAVCEREREGGGEAHGCLRERLWGHGFLFVKWSGVEWSGACAHLVEEPLVDVGHAPCVAPWWISHDVLRQFRFSEDSNVRGRAAARGCYKCLRAVEGRRGAAQRVCNVCIFCECIQLCVLSCMDRTTTRQDIRVAPLKKNHARVTASVVMPCLDAFNAAPPAILLLRPARRCKATPRATVRCSAKRKKNQ